MNKFDVYERIGRAVVTLFFNGIERKGYLGEPYEEDCPINFIIDYKEDDNEFLETHNLLDDCIDDYPQKLVDLLKIDSGELLAYKECAPLSESEIYPPTFALTKGEDGLRFWKRYQTNWYCEKPSLSGEEIRLWAALFDLNPKDLI